MENLNDEQRQKVTEYARKINCAFDAHKSVCIITNQFSGLRGGESGEMTFIKPSYYYTAEFHPLEKVHDGVCKGEFCKCGNCQTQLLELKLKKIRYLSIE
jgi:predicted PP-loop superfamily ATPase